MWIVRQKMTAQELCELAEAELEIGSPDRELAARALAEAEGVKAKARQIYWLLRAEQLRTEAGKMAELQKYWQELRQDIERKRRVVERRESLRGWLHALAVYGAFTTAFIFGCAALPAYLRHSDAALRYAVLACSFAAGGLFASVRLRRGRQIDPFENA